MDSTTPRSFDGRQRVLVLVDEANFAGSARALGRRADWLRLRDYLADPNEGRFLIEMVAYVGMPPDHPDYQQLRERKKSFLYWLQSNGLLVVTKEGIPTGSGHYNANVDVVMAVDGIQLAVDLKPDIVVLVTGDNEFAYLATTLRRRGIRVEVASPPSTLSNQLRAAASGVIDLTPLMNEAAPLESPPGKNAGATDA
jgi:uncharacterized LabA/DUF88 family protein